MNIKGQDHSVTLVQGLSDGPMLFIFTTGYFEVSNLYMPKADVRDSKC